MTIAEHRRRSLHRWTGRRVPVLRVLFGGMFVVGAAVHVYLAATRPAVYAGFADGAFFGFVRSAWESLVLPDATRPMLSLAVFELGAGLLVLYGVRRYAFVGAVLMAAFHVALLAFGWGFWVSSLPVLVLLAALLDGLRESPENKR